MLIITLLLSCLLDPPKSETFSRTFTKTIDIQNLKCNSQPEDSQVCTQPALGALEIPWRAEEWTSEEATVDMPAMAQSSLLAALDGIPYDASRALAEQWSFMIISSFCFHDDPLGCCAKIKAMK